ncbi:Lrp/AsnC family transcriptional regulator [Oscillatoria sp. FACHB-1407]|uniref:Lrp/AsnC family transcriptional regulator n=1 Tax=Oscillatoria sp. FACHB-1407 TaxID=2692847 RepID=UPI001681E9A0|nr:Lrp/AsnC family transcriptional regulator [Oscillatoria sp. FACHB-1407]MBD2463542.1 Lrp/AsnC family transcriptional regulator [Oscillatoria sp. FACHB-1407]
MQSGSTPNSISTLDEIDQDIINLLRIDGRMSFTEIGKRLNMPEATARYRVQRLLQSGIVQVLAWPNLEKLGTPHVLIVSLIVENSYIDSVAKALEQMVEVRFVAITTGHYDIIADVFFGSYTEVTSFFEKLKQIPGIVRHDSHFILKLLKAEYKYTLS